MRTVDIRKRIDDGARYLLAAQDDDGLWRDYQLAPGPSEAWVTSIVGLALVRAGIPVASGSALSRAADALHRHRKAAGWSYNMHTAPDADSTAWTLRLLSSCGALRDLDVTGLLIPFVNDNGGARTFMDPDRFGNWAAVHADVTPIVGLALAKSGADATLLQRMRQACLDARDDTGLWHAFWWTVPAYAIARNLEFLAIHEGIPEECKRTARQWLLSAHEPDTAFGAAQHLAIASLLKVDPLPSAKLLLARQRAEGGWPPSPVLLVPPQWSDAVNLAEPNGNADEKGLMTTAVALLALLGSLS